MTPVRYFTRRFGSVPAAIILAAVGSVVFPVWGADAPAVETATVTEASAPATETPTAVEPPSPTLPEGSVIIQVNKTGSKIKPSAGYRPTYRYQMMTLQTGDYTDVSPPVDDEQDLTYTITVKNTSSIQAKNLEVEYHFYNFTQKVAANISATPVLDDITDLKRMDIEPDKAGVIVLPPIPKAIKSSLIKLVLMEPAPNYYQLPHGAPAGGLKIDPAHSTFRWSTTTSLVGWHVEVRCNDEVIAQVDSPKDLQEKLDSIQQAVASGEKKQNEFDHLFLTPVVLKAPATDAKNQTAPAVPKGSVSFQVKITEGKAGIHTGRSGATSRSGQISPDGEWQNVKQNLLFSKANTYIISLRNSAKVPLENVEVEYHFYYRSVKEGSESTTVDWTPTNKFVEAPTVTEFTATQEVSLPPGKLTDVVCPPIPPRMSLNSSDKYTDVYYEHHSGINRPSIPKIYNTYTLATYLGWHVEVRYHNTVIAQGDETADLKNTVGDIIKKGGQGIVATVATADDTAASDAPGPPLPKGSVTLNVSRLKVLHNAPESHHDGYLDHIYVDVDKLGYVGTITYGISVKNATKIPVKNLEVEYHFYNLIKKTDFNVVRPTVVDDITAIQRVNVDPGKTFNLPELHIPDDKFTAVAALASAVIAPGFDKTQTVHSSTLSDLVGYHVEVRYNGAVIAQATEPSDLKSKLEQAKQTGAKK